MSGPDTTAAFRAALVAMLAGFLAAGPALSGGDGAAVSPELASQKSMMLKGFFASSRLGKARETNPDAVAPLEAEARTSLEAGEAALAAGQVAKAIELFDKGTRAVSRAVALGSTGANWDRQAASAAYVERRTSAGSYLSVLEQADDLSNDERASVNSLRDRMLQADRAFAAGNLAQASETLNSAYGDVVDLVSKIRRGHTITVSRVFETPKDEFEYELERHRSYVLLVEIALAERGEDQPGLALLAARLGFESEQLRERAEEESARGDYVLAIDTMENATERLLVILRATGVIVME